MSLDSPTHVESLQVGTPGSEVDAIGDDGTLYHTGTEITATAAEINSAADVSARVVTLTGDTTLTAATHEGRILLLGEVGGNASLTVTLPDATGSGAVFRFIVSVTNTSNYVIQAPDSDNTFVGYVSIVDADDNSINGYDIGGTDDTITLNGGTQGGQKGDWIEFVDILADTWHVRGQLVCPTGSNPSDPASEAVPGA